MNNLSRGCVLNLPKVCDMVAFFLRNSDNLLHELQYPLHFEPEEIPKIFVLGLFPPQMTANQVVMC